MQNNCKLDLIKSDDYLVLSFGKFPFWQGVFEKPGVTKALDFQLDCKKGGHIKLNSSSFNINDVTDVYKSSDYNFITTPPGASEWSNLLGDISIDWVNKLIPKDFLVNNILEIGAGSLYVAKGIKELFDVKDYVIVDPSIRETSPEFKIFREYFPSDKLAKKKFELILAFHTLEHLPEPENFLNSIKEYLSLDGLVMLTFPDSERQLRLGDLNVLLHEHVNYFTEASLRKFVHKCGFELLELKTFDDTFVILIKANLKSDINFIMDFEDKEPELLITCQKSFENSISRIKTLIESQFLLGNTVGFHGATNGLNSLLHLLGIYNSSRIRIYDGDQNKVGKYLPSFHEKILSSEDESYASNSIMIISAITYFDSIKKFAQQKHGLRDDQIFSMA